MNPAPLRILGDNGPRRIHDAALRILDQTGMLVDHDGALEILSSAGARVERATRRVTFPPALVEEKVGLIPREITYFGRDPQFDVTLTVDGDVYSRVPGGAPGYIDLATGAHRRAVLADWREFAVLADALPNIHVIATMHCGDVPEALADIHSLSTLLVSQRKPIVHNAFSLENHRLMLEMVLAVRGSREALAERPLYHHMLSPISPLFLNEDDIGQLLLACEYGIPTDMPIMPIAAFTGPITMGGLLVQSLAEYLGAAVLAQSARPGHAMPFFVDPVIGDLRTGNARFGAPEVGLLVAGISQIGRELYGFPPQAIGLDADGFSLGDIMFQKAQNMAFQTMAGGKLLIGPGCVDATMALDPAILVIDDQLVEVARSWARGVPLDDESLAVEAIIGVGPRGDFMADDLTIEHLRDGTILDVGLFEAGMREQWEAAGSKDIRQRAAEKGRAILDRHEVPPLPDDVVRELDAIVAAAGKALVDR
jgi:trimethylamine--corrinoid protein Co-methyltransferase